MEVKSEYEVIADLREEIALAYSVQKFEREAYRALQATIDRIRADVASLNAERLNQVDAIDRITAERDDALALAAKLNGGEELKLLMEMNNKFLARAFAAEAEVERLREHAVRGRMAVDDERSAEEIAALVESHPTIRKIRTALVTSDAQS